MNLDDLKIDDRYQRPIDEKKVEFWVKNWDRDCKCGHTVHVHRLGEGACFFCDCEQFTPK